MDMRAKFRGLNVLVIGDLILDEYSEHKATGKSPDDDPAPVVVGLDTTRCLGGAGNVAANAKTMGAGRVELLAYIGSSSPRFLESDRYGLFEYGLKACDIRIARCPNVEGSNPVKARFVVDGRTLARVDSGELDVAVDARSTRMIAGLRRAVEESRPDVVLVADYELGTMKPLLIHELAELRGGKLAGSTLVVDAKDPAKYRACKPTAITPNYAQALAMLGVPPLDGTDRRWFGTSELEALRTLAAAENVAVTLDRDGSVAIGGGTNFPVRVPAGCKEPACTIGAGDTYAAALGMVLGAGATLEEAARAAQRAADVAVAKPYTATCHGEELFPPADVPKARPGVVLATGCFDVIHAGHVAMLAEAAKLGDELVVGINSDEGVRRLKGADRPIHCVEDRRLVLEQLRGVSSVVIFDEDTPEALIREVRPSVFVKGGDYSRATLPERAAVEEMGGRVVILPLLCGRSTTGVLEKLPVPDEAWAAFE